MNPISSVLLFLLAGLCEVGGGYLIWQWLKEGRPWWFGILGGSVLFLYGILATFHPVVFGQVYVVYGGVFIVWSILWSYLIDGYVPNRYDLIGGIITLIGVSIIYFGQGRL